MVASFTATGVLLPFLGKPALLCLLAWAMGLVFGGVYAIVGWRVRRLKATRTQVPGDVAEEQIVRRPLESPGLAVLHPDKLELVPIAGPTIRIRLAAIRTVSETRWLNGKRLWWKRGFGLELAGGERVSFAVPEHFAREWRAPLSCGALPQA